MKKSIPILIAVLLISITLGSATALIVPVELSTTDNVKLYTKTTLFEVGSGAGTDQESFCDAGDKIINGFFKDISEPIDSFGNLQSNAIKPSSGLEGWKIRFTNGGPAQTFEFVIVCGKIVPMMSVGGMLLEPDSTALMLAYGIANAFWIAPAIAGIGVGIYLVKRKF